MKSYPYVGKFQHAVKLFYAPNKFELPESGNGLSRHESNYTNITHEYLSNTYGEVESSEHAEFILELCESNGIEIFNHYDEGITHFAINKGEVIFTYGKPAISDHDKQITIPLPPKAEPIKNAGDNLILGCEDSKCDEWPKIGDEILVYSSVRRLAEIKGKAVKVIGKCTHSYGDTILTVEHSSLGVFAVAEGSWIKKPKTPEEELRDNAIKNMSQSIRNKMPKINWDEAESISSDLYDFGYRKPQ